MTRARPIERWWLVAAPGANLGSLVSRIATRSICRGRETTARAPSAGRASDAGGVAPSGKLDPGVSGRVAGGVAGRSRKSAGTSGRIGRCRGKREPMTSRREGEGAARSRSVGSAGWLAPAGPSGGGRARRSATDALGTARPADASVPLASAGRGISAALPWFVFGRDARVPRRRRSRERRACARRRRVSGRSA